MARFDPPPKFSYKAVEWEEWLADFYEYRITAKVDKEEGNVQISSLLYSMGAKRPEKYIIHLSMGKYVFRPLMDVERRKLTREVMTIAPLYVNLTNISSRKKKFIHERLVFNEHVQRPDEAVEEVSTSLQTLVQSCGYKESEDLVRSRFVIGLVDVGVKQMLQLMPELTLDKAT